MIVIPMAGKSSRFFNEGYNKPKYMLPLFGRSNVFKESLKSFKNYFESDFFLFVSRSDHDAKNFIQKQCMDLGIKKFEIVILNKNTKGQAETVKIGIEKMKSISNEEIYIFNIDSIRINFTKPTKSFLKNTDGYLEVFKGKGDHWSFIEVDDDKLVKRTTEKIRISNYCSNGLYYFSSTKLFLDTFSRLEISNNYNEYFIAPMYNILIERGKKVKYRLLNNDQTLFSGTPIEYELLKKSFVYK